MSPRGTKRTSPSGQATSVVRSRAEATSGGRKPTRLTQSGSRGTHLGKVPICRALTALALLAKIDLFNRKANSMEIFMRGFFKLSILGLAGFLFGVSGSANANVVGYTEFALTSAQSCISGCTFV